MTSPAQLKYLEAMSIPVWVSRDLVTIVEKNSLTDNSLAKGQDHFSSAPAAPAANNSAQSILNYLDGVESTESNSIEKNDKPNKDVETVPNTISNKNTVTSTIDVAGSNDNLLYKSSKHYLFASGAKNADWLVIGYSPEMYSGIGYEPFAADAGELLVNMLKAVGIDNPRKQAYLINVFDINRSNDEQINDLESINLRNQLISKVTSINPKMILLVGQLAAQNLLEIDDPLVIMRSKLHQLGENKIPCVVTYYPTYLVQKPIDKRKAWDDLKMAMSALNNVS